MTIPFKMRILKQAAFILANEEKTAVVFYGFGAEILKQLAIKEKKKPNYFRPVHFSRPFLKTKGMKKSDYRPD